MEPAPRGFHSTEDLRFRADEYRQRAGTARTADIQGALLKLAELYDETADAREEAAQRQLLPSDSAQIMVCPTPPRVRTEQDAGCGALAAADAGVGCN